MNRVPLALAAPLLLLAGCGQESAADKNAEALGRAAEQSMPGAADILRNADPGANVQDVVQEAADPVPPPKVPAEGKGR